MASDGLESIKNKLDENGVREKASEVASSAKVAGGAVVNATVAAGIYSN